MSVRIGLLGLGTVGQAVAHAAAAAPLAAHGVTFSLECALVRDPARARRAPRVARITSNVEAFLRGRYDVVIDALPGREAAAAVVARVLGKGVPVVSANKGLIAAEGPRLRRIAARAGTTLRVEAAVIAGVPFLGALERRPLAGSATRLTGVLNGTSHFIVTRIAAGARFADALDEATALGYAEPDPSADVSGRDARDKVIVLAYLLLAATLDAGAIALDGIADLTPGDLAAAAALGGVLKPVARAARTRGGIAAFAGPAWLPASHPLAAISGRDNGILIEGRHIDRLFFAGPGAGPEITAATLLDDAVEAARDHGRPVFERPPSVPMATTAAHTGWFVRVDDPRHPRGGMAAARGAFSAAGFDAKTREDGGTTWLVLREACGERVDAVCAGLHAAGNAVRTWRALHD